MDRNSATESMYR